MLSDVYQKEGCGPVPCVSVGVQTGEEEEEGCARTSCHISKRLSRLDNLLCGSIWLTKDPIFHESSSRCIPLAISIYPVIQRIHRKIEGNQMVSSVKSLSNISGKSVRLSSRCTRIWELPLGEEEIVVSPDVDEQINKLRGLYHQLRQVNIEWPFWRHLNYVALLIEKIMTFFPFLPRNKALKHDVEKCQMEGMSTYILGSLLVEIGMLLHQLCSSVRMLTDAPCGLQEAVEDAHHILCYVRVCVAKGVYGGPRVRSTIVPLLRSVSHDKPSDIRG